MFRGRISAFESSPKTFGSWAAWSSWTRIFSSAFRGWAKTTWNLPAWGAAVDDAAPAASATVARTATTSRFTPRP